MQQTSDVNSNRGYDSEFYLAIIYRMIPVVETLVFQLNRLSLSLFVLGALGLLVLRDPTKLPDGTIGPLDYQLIWPTLPIIVLLASLDLGYKSFRYILVREKLEEYLNCFFELRASESDASDSSAEASNNAMEEDDDLDSGASESRVAKLLAEDVRTDHQELAAIIIPTSIFTTIVGLNPEFQGKLHGKKLFFQWFFFILLVSVYAFANSVSIHYAFLIYPENWNWFVIFIAGVVYATAYYHYLETTHNVYYSKLVYYFASFQVFGILLIYFFI